MRYADTTLNAPATSTDESLNEAQTHAIETSIQDGDTKMFVAATANSSQAQGPSLSTSVQKHIGNLLKVSYQDLLTEPVPDRFASLLEQLEQAETKGK